uniref:L1 transposable element RRM domain-containing protein n=1 Tax=Erpetoichthys calabaricus TaxID=27687 RepID=A0A8C4RNA6_ERPCA
FIQPEGSITVYANHLKLEKALQSALSPTPREPGTSAVIEVTASPTVHESRNDLSELKLMIAELKQEIKNDNKEINKYYAQDKREDKLAALEDGCRRNKIRIEGFPANRESPNPVKFIAELFSKIIVEDFKSDTEKAEVYRIRGLNNSKHRTFIVRFEKLQSNLNVMSLLRQKQEIMFENNLICIFLDFSPSTATKCASFYNIKQHLRKADIRYSLLYPAKLKVEIQGKHYIFTSREEADKELRKEIKRASYL